MRWRGPREVAFRARQELRNAALWLAPPSLPAEPARTILPDPSAAAKAIRTTRTAAEIVASAGRILEHRFPILGLEIAAGKEIHWRRDYVNGKETGRAYFRRIPYLDVARAGDHKVIWELNRHQHLVLLAQAWRLTGRAEFPAEIARQLDSWMNANPFQRGINWTSALEVAFRALSWIWILELAGETIDPPLRRRMLEELYRHGLHLACNLSFYFSPNTHLLGEAVALHALGLLFRDVRSAETWETTGADVVAREMQRQVRPDGSHFEQSTYYHVYALDMFLFHAILAPPAESYRRSLERMAEYLDAWLGPARSLPLVGDDDGGRFFYPFAPKKRYGLATLAACGAFLGRPEWMSDPEAFAEQGAWWLGPRSETAPEIDRYSRLFADSGAAVMVAGPAFCAVDVGPFGPFPSGHSHADTLSIVAGQGDRELLIDPGTFTYVGDEYWRNLFRGTAAHNTIRVRGLDQADPAGPFAWSNPPAVQIRKWESTAESDYLDAECRYRDCTHRRRVFFLKPLLLFVLDEVTCPGSFDAEQFWHAADSLEPIGPVSFRIAESATLLLDGAAELASGWRSRAFGVKEPSPAVVRRQKGADRLRFGAVLALPGAPAPSTLTIEDEGEAICLVLSGPGEQRIRFGESFALAC